MRKVRLKLAILNIQTGVSITKGYWQYLILFWKTFVPHSSRVLEKIGDFAKREKIDILGLTEVDFGSIRSGYENQAEFIGEIAGFRYRGVFPTHKFWRFFNHGNAVLSNLRRIKSAVIKLPGILEPRYLVKLEINVGAKKFVLLVSHLSIISAVRKKQIERLTKIACSIKSPVVIMGDFNVMDNAELIPLRKCGFENAGGHKTFPSWNPKIALDVVLVKNARVVNSYVYGKDKFSDHLPIVAEVEI